MTATKPSSDGADRRGNPPLIIAQKPSKVSLHHQPSVHSSDESEEWEDVQSFEQISATSPPPHPPSPSHSTSCPAIHSSQLTPEPEDKKKKKKGKRKRSGLFRWRKKKGELEPPTCPVNQYSSYESDSGDSNVEFADILMDPSKLKGSVSVQRSEKLVPPASGMYRSTSDSAVSHDLSQRSSQEEGRKARQKARDWWLVYVVLASGRGLAIRDRTGTSDPYVKFKCGQFKYRSNVIHRNLNPEWNEAFSFKTQDLSLPLKVKVYDHDYGSLDDYMGGGTVSLESYIHGQLHIVDIGLRDEHAKEKSLGTIRLFLTISPHREEERDRMTPNPQSIQVWNSVLTIHLLEGSDLPAMDDNGFSDPYCKFKLGRQKLKSKVVPKTLNPHWKEQFDVRLYDGESSTLHIEVWDRDLLQSDDFIGETSVELDSLTQEQTHDLTLPLEGSVSGTIHILLTITGTAVREEEEGDTHSPGHKRPTAELDDMARKYSILQVLNCRSLRDIGYLRVTIDHVERLEKLSDVFVIVELGNSQARTHTVRKSATPTWEKTFHFDIKDLHSPLEVTLYGQAKAKPDFIGMVMISLLRLEPGVMKGYVLKDKQCVDRSRGVLYLQCDLVYQPIRAAIRTVKPRETKLMEKETTFQRKVLMHNIKRITALVQNLSAGITTMRDIFNWKSKLKSSITFLVFIIVCVFGELWMLPLLMAVGFIVQYVVVYMRGRHVWQRQARHRAVSMDTPLKGVPSVEVSDYSDLEDDLEAAASGAGKKNIREKFRQIQEVLLIVQNVLGDIADTGERINNLFNWSIPFLCWMAIVVLFGATLVFFFTPLRYVVLIWGINKFTKKLRKPNHIPYNDLLEFVGCSPSNHELQQLKELPIRPPRSRSRSPAVRKT